MPQEFIDLATQKLALINAAYDRIRREREGAAALS
jgi:DnaJ like chaperone protein